MQSFRSLRLRRVKKKTCKSLQDNKKKTYIFIKLVLIQNHSEITMSEKMN